MQGDTGGRIIKTGGKTGNSSLGDSELEASVLADPIIMEAIDRYRANPSNLIKDEPTEETKKRWFFWSLLVARGKKHNYAGTVSQKVIDVRRAKNKVAKASRKANRRG